MERLTPLADAFLEAEDVDPYASLAIGSLAVFAGPAPAYEELVETIVGRLPLIPRYRQKLRPVPLGLAAPAWVDDEHFDIHHHLRPITVPAPGGRRQVEELLSRLMTTRMDRARPLWEYWFWTGLADGRWALLSKVHHSVVDGVSGTDLYRLLLDPSPERRPGVPDTWLPESSASTAEVTVGALRELLASPVHLAGTLAHAARTPRRLVRTTARTTSGLLTLGGAVRPVHRSSLSGPLGGDRRYTWTTVPMDDLLTVRSAYDATVNDVALAAVTGGFRRLLLARGEPTDAHTLRSLVPVSTRHPGEESVLENRVSLMLPFLPVDVADPVARLATIRRRIRGLRGHHEPEAGESITEAAELSPFPSVSWGLRLGWRLPQHQITTVTTNVPGPRTPLYALGREALEMLPYVPIADRVRIGVAMFSYRDTLTFGITGDRDSTADLDVLAVGIAGSLAELVATTRRTG
ncbi:wax ester/triacylglycerol synthase family O-acyltransferase [Nocardioides panaciterrulae]|uniref:Diacylglycerol O-acyltransferase n=1 Tax=Nocardioides panaciterrulae TaxID=661492 RepID=A0A7Y9J9S2_9ACTN|nr:diacylglycerol O-acyltransferase [Nocardioides panaciterrulae]